MLTVTLYTRPECHLCNQAEIDLNSLQDKIPHQLVKINIDSEPELQREYALLIPVVEVGPYKLKAPFSRQELEISLLAALDRKDQLERLGDSAYKKAVKRGQTITSADSFSFWLSKYYMPVFNIFLLLYVGLPFLAPVFIKANLYAPAKVIYAMYRPLCHQWGFRSWFLFGEQLAYPHASAGIEGLITFEEATGISDQSDPNRIAAREYEGNSVVGYKVALCERDVAIWGALLMFGIIFSITGRRIPRLHWIAWLLIGLVPVGLDGFSQLFSQLPIQIIHKILPYRESTPFLRSLTGFLFGFSTAWFGFPSIEEAMVDTRLLLTKKFAAITGRQDS